MMLTVRTFIINESSLEEAGIWEAAMRIGVYFNMIFALPISVHYLPIFSNVSKRSELSDAIKEMIKSKALREEYGIAGRHFVKEKYCRDNLCPNMDILYTIRTGIECSF